MGWNQKGKNTMGKTGNFTAFAVLSYLLLGSAAWAQIDRDLDGFRDLWEIKYEVEGAPDPNDDPDGDSATNAEEERMGTDPFDADSVLHASIEHAGGDAARIRWSTIAGKTYRPRLTSDLGQPLWIAPEFYVGGAENGEVAIVIDDAFITGVEGVLTREHFESDYSVPREDWFDGPAIGTSWVNQVESQPYESRGPQRIFGWVVPPESGEYVFHHMLPEDTYSEFWLATDGVATNAVRLSADDIDEDDYPYPGYVFFDHTEILQAGVPVYLELRSGSAWSTYPVTNAVRWILPGDTEPTPIPADALRTRLADPVATLPAGTATWCAEIEVFDRDSDGDTITDWEEIFAGTGPFATFGPVGEVEFSEEIETIGSRFDLFHLVRVDVEDARNGATVYSGREGDIPAIRVEVQRSTYSASPLPVTLWLEGDAITGSDYAAPAGGAVQPVELVVTIPGGEYQAYVEIPIFNDDLPEPDKEIRLGFPYQPAVLFEQRGNHSYLIRDDDRPKLGMEVVDPSAAESGGDTAQVRVYRSGDLSAPYSAMILQSGTAVEGLDYAPLPAVDFAAGEDEVLLTISPLPDAEDEGSETVELRLAPSSTYDFRPHHIDALLTIRDQSDAGGTLYLARYGPEGDAETAGWGYATLRLADDGESAVINTRFANLTSPQTTAHIHLGPEGTTGPVVEGLANGEVVDHVWTFGGDKDEMLDALTNGLLYANVHSVNYPAGEIRGQFLPVEGSVAFTPPASVAADAGLPGSSYQEAFRFLLQSTYGPRPAEVAVVQEDGIAAWLDQQIAMPATSQHAMQQSIEKAFRDALVSPNLNFNFRGRLAPGSWWTSAVHAPDQLRQRLAFALSEIFVISIRDDKIREAHLARAAYHDMLGEHAFGNFRDLLYDVSRHPLMGQYLSHLRNQKPDPENNIFPDENFAREVMQLFSIGLFELHPDGSLRLDAAGLPIPTYGQGDISELARVFTGWGLGYHNYANYYQPGFPNENDSFFNGAFISQVYHEDQEGWYLPMKQFPAYHDPDPKRIIGGLDLVGLDGEAELDLVVDSLFLHPNTGPFISRLLIQRLVTSNPSPGYIYRVAQAFADNGQGVRGDMAAVVRAIYLDAEARDMDLVPQAGSGKLREPLLAMTHIIRNLDYARPDGPPDPNPIPWLNIGDLAPFPGQNSMPPDELVLTIFDGESLDGIFLPQLPFGAPNVFNFFDPDFIPVGDLSSARLRGPEFSFMSDQNLYLSIDHFDRAVNFLYVLQREESRTAFSVPTAERPALTDPGEIIDRLDDRFLGRSMSPALRNILEVHLPNTPNSLRLFNARRLVVLSPEFHTQR